MEADWSVEIGPGLPVIDVIWDGFVDLRSSPDKVDTVEEARRQPAIREALLALNGGGSHLITTKCDCWSLTGAEIDPDEFSASRKAASMGFASYIDVVDCEPDRFVSFELQEQRARAIISALRTLELRQGRVDLVVRAAVQSTQNGFGLTLYAAGCGASEADAHAAWQAVLAAAAAATIAAATQFPCMGE
ncbi:MAG TPA: hypothetical protein VN610_00960 [Bryobacteraceae bacterium]|nr:hypothetical protein [Bryobacteraceae bacterium]